MAAISAVFTIGYVANRLGEDEDWLHDLSADMFPEDGCLCIYGVGEDGVPAFTQDGIDNLRQIIADQRAAGRAPPQVPQNSLRWGPHRMLTAFTRDGIDNLREIIADQRAAGKGPPVKPLK